MTLEEALEGRLPIKGNGCEYWDNCETCPYPDCLFGEDKVKASVKAKKFKVQELAKERIPAKQIAEELGMSLRTIQRYLAKKD